MGTLLNGGRRAAPLLLWALLLVPAPPAGGSLAEQLPLEALVARADTIALATVARVETSWSQDHRHLQRWVELRRELTLKGRPGESTSGAMLLRLRGGTRDGLTETVVGEPNLEPGQRGLFFLRVWETGGAPVHSLVGLGQGAVLVDAEGVARQTLDGLALASVDAQGRMSVAGAGEGGLLAMALPALVEQVRQCLAQAR